VGLPVDYMKAIDGVRIGPDVGSCGTAAWSGELVIVSDIEHDPRWANYRDVALPHGLRSCWSRPFKNRKGAVLGCFALYAKEARGPTEEELEIITEAANLLGIALEQRATERENKLLHAAMESAAEVVVVTDEAGVITFANQVLDPSVQAMPAAALSHLLPALFGPEVEPLLDAVRHVTSWEGRLRRLPECATAPGAWFQVKLTHAVSAQGTAGLLLTMSDVTATIEQERLQRLGTEGEKAKVAVAWALSVAAELRVRCEAALASVVGLLVPQGAGAVYVRESGAGHFERFAQAGEGADAFVLAPSSGCVCGQRLAGASTVVVDRCSENPAHGHYLVPLMERAHEPLGYLLLHTEPSPTRAAPRLEALGMIAELITIAVVRDRADHLLRASKVAAEEANRAKSDFLATMSHEIRTPMNGILGFSELLLEAPLPDEQRGQLRLIRNSAEALLTVINDVLDYSKIEAGKFVIEPRPMNLVEATREPLELLRDAATRKGLSMELTLGSDLPLACLVDPLRYRQVVLNLVGNAVKFTARGQVRVSVSQVTEGLRRLVRVEVADSGIGISAEVLPRLFEKFVQADSSTSRRFGGSGLGLAISRKLVALMGGTMGVTSEVGVGSTFWFQLPAVDAVMPAASRVAQTAPISLLGKRVLVAEDNEVNQLLARRTLERLGCEVVMAVNGVEAVAHARAGGFDLILMDCQMPELDGIAATSAIRAWEREQALPRLPIIALTASAFVEEVARCMEAGMDDVLTKPFKLADLASLLSRPPVAAAVAR
jgi:signal transduction histidine kinase/ActR/RegA family two-component response regulator/PAS domain-containing protein